ncbi:MAG: hypothetical protein WKF71_17525 [Pyrinomonadaceae bacterium]
MTHLVVCSAAAGLAEATMTSEDAYNVGAMNTRIVKMELEPT